MPSEPFEYPPAVTDFDAYDAQTHLEGGTAEAMEAADRMDRRTEAAVDRIRHLAGAAVHHMISGISVREVARLVAEAEEYLARTGALGFSRRETAAAVLDAQQRYDWMTLAQAEGYVWQAMTEGRLTPGGSPTPGPRPSVTADAVPTMESWLAGIEGLHRIGRPVQGFVSGPPLCPHDGETLLSDVVDDHVVSYRQCADCGASTIGTDREAPPLYDVLLTTSES